MKLKDLLRDVEVQAPSSAGDVEVHTLSYHSSKVEAGSLFFAWKGSLHDGHLYIPKAIEQGAVAIVTDVPVADCRVPVVVVSSVRAGLSRIAANFFGHPAQKLKMISVTGTNGKTSTAFLMHDFLSRSGLKTGLMGTVICDYGDGVVEASRTTPEGLEVQFYLQRMVQSGCKAAVMEVTSHALDQGRVDGISYDVSLFTNLTQDHLDYHGSMEAYFTAKQKLFARALPGQFAVLNIDDPWSDLLRKTMAPGVNILTYSIEGKADFSARSLRFSTSGTSFELNSPQGTFQAQARWIGSFNVSNILAALAAGYASGLSVEKMVGWLKTQPFVPGRMEVVPHSMRFSVLIDYAHTGDALKKVLQALRPLTQGKLKVVIGCGGSRDRSKRPKMAAIACELADEAMFTSDNPRTEKSSDILTDMIAGVESFNNYQVIEDRAQAIEEVIRSAKPGDVILIAGKGHEGVQEIDGVKYPFSDREIARSVLEGVAA